MKYLINHYLDGEYAASRSLRVFISSTFSDMQAERDMLVKHTFAALQAKAAEAFVNIEPVDLRWGITEADSHSGRVVDLCLKEIKRTRPLFIGIVGDRYGWCPTEHEVMLGDDDNEFSWVYNDLRSGMSITEIEMQYGALRNPDKIKSFFYLKRSVGEPAAERLKETIKSSPGVSWREYSTPEELSELVSADMMTLLTESFRLETSHYTFEDQTEYRQKMASAAFLSDKLKVLSYTYENAHVHEDIWDFLENQSWPTLVLYGPKGSGKTTLIADIFKDWNWSHDLIYIAPGVGGMASDSDSLIISLCRMIAESHRYLKVQLNERLKPRERFEDFIEQIMHESYDSAKIVICIDQIERLDIEARSLDWMPRLDIPVKLILCTSDYRAFADAFERKRIQYIEELKRPEIQLRKDIIEKYLAQSAKALKPELADFISSSQLTENLHLLKSLLDVLIRFGRHEDLDRFIENLLDAASPQDFYSRLWIDADEEYKNVPVRDILALTCLSQYGLSESDLLRITDTKPIDWVEFYGTYSPMFDVSSGRLRLIDDDAAEAAMSGFTQEEIRKLRLRIVEEGVGFTEDAYQYFNLRDAEDLWALISNHDAFETLYNRQYDWLVKYWRFLETEGYKVSDIEITTTDNLSLRQYYKIANFIIENLQDKTQAIPYYEANFEHYEASNAAEMKMHFANRLNILWGMAGNREKADYYSQQAMDLGDTEDRASALVNRGRDLTKYGDYDEAVKAFEEGIAIYSRLAKRNERRNIGDLGRALNNLSIAYRQMGRLEDAANTGLQAVEYQRKAYGYSVEWRVSFYRTLYNTGQYLFLLERKEESEALLKEAISVMDYDREWQDYSLAASTRLLALGWLKRYDESIDAADDFIEKCRLKDDKLRTLQAEVYKKKYQYENLPRICPLSLAEKTAMLIPQYYEVRAMEDSFNGDEQTVMAQIRQFLPYRLNDLIVKGWQYYSERFRIYLQNAIKDILEDNKRDCSIPRYYTDEAAIERKINRLNGEIEEFTGRLKGYEEGLESLRDNLYSEVSQLLFSANDDWRLRERFHLLADEFREAGQPVEEFVAYTGAYVIVKRQQKDDAVFGMLKRSLDMFDGLSDVLEECVKENPDFWSELSDYYNDRADWLSDSGDEAPKERLTTAAERIRQYLK